MRHAHFAPHSAYILASTNIPQWSRFDGELSLGTGASGVGTDVFPRGVAHRLNIRRVRVNSTSLRTAVRVHGLLSVENFARVLAGVCCEHCVDLSPFHVSPLLSISWCP